MCMSSNMLKDLYMFIGGKMQFIKRCTTQCKDALVHLWQNAVCQKMYTSFSGKLHMCSDDKL